MEKYIRLEYFFILMVLIWDPVQRFILKVDGAGYSITLLTIVVLLFLIKKKYFYKIAFKKPLMIYCFWLLYTYINSIIIGQGHDIPFLSFITQITVPFVLMTVISLEYVHNKKRLLNVLIFGMYLGVILVLIFVSKTDQGRIGGEMNSNTIGIMATILTLLLYLKYYYRGFSIYFFSILVAVPVVAIIMTGSRTAFGGLTLLIILHFFIYRSSSFWLSTIKIVLGFIFFMFPMKYILENTALGERILNTSNQSDGMEFQTGNPVLDAFGDRGFFYYQGWEVLKEKPITGIGLGNFKNYNSLELAQHSEYMIQLTELGAIGFLLFAYFYFFILKNLNEIRLFIRNKREAELYIGYILIVLAMITATRMYRVWFMFLILGLVIGFIVRTKQINYSKKLRLK
ncbi:O-antigen ligase family protein [Arenibacter sp. M-2]|uniref:O-antigen ligase family protein n=1 Tax=Arenibacter sp. M-2 TaxID=3053612 RepID=UPI00256FECFA|nr:O-antigen ligase family protein [Arenibacter sp. M-2]MDL5514661.1 O-antigen ligase family protein [Arenibacter sp. M-2]